MAITLTDVASGEMLIACPACGSTDLTMPLRGRSTGLWLCFCRGCGADILSKTPFTVERRSRRDQPKPVREIGEEG